MLLASALLAFPGLIQPMMPLTRLGASGGLLSVPDGVFLEVYWPLLHLGPGTLLFLPPGLVPFVFPDAFAVAVEHHLLVQGFLAVRERHHPMTGSGNQHVPGFIIDLGKGPHRQHRHDLIDRPAFGRVTGDAHALIQAREFPVDLTAVLERDFFTIDCRHPQSGVLDAMVKDLGEAIAKLAADTALGIDWKRIWDSPPVAFDPDCIACVKEGAENFLTKPIDPAALTVALKRSIDNRQSWQRNFGARPTAEQELLLMSVGSVAHRARRQLPAARRGGGRLACWLRRAGGDR